MCALFCLYSLYRFGFSEFNSDTYAPIAYKAIAALVGLSENPEIQILAEMVMNLQLFDHIIGSKGRRLVVMPNYFSDLEKNIADFY